MKRLAEILIGIFLHPIAVILAWIDIFARGDLSTGKKVLWALLCTLWGIGPILYVALGDGALW